MNLKIDCRKVEITPGVYPDKVTVEIIDEEIYSGQLEHYIDVLFEKYGDEFLDSVKKRFDLEEV